MHKTKTTVGKRIKSLMFHVGAIKQDDCAQYEKAKQASIEVDPFEDKDGTLCRARFLVQAQLPQQETHLTLEDTSTTDSTAVPYHRLGHDALDTKRCRALYPYLPDSWINRNRALSFRSKSSNKNDGNSGRKGFSFQSLRGNLQPELSRKLYKVIKSTNNLISAHDTAAKERTIIATQLSEWGEQTQDESVSDISDKVGVILSELGDQEDTYAHNLDDSRGILKAIRNTEKSVQPSRDNKARIADEIAKLKMKEPQSTKIVVLEQELVRAEAENLVAEAQLTNITRQKLKEAYAAEFAAVIERAERQIILAKHGRRLLTLLDDSPMTPGDAQRPYQHGNEARQILSDAEEDLRKWELNLDDEPFHGSQGDAVDPTTESSIATGRGYGEQEAGAGAETGAGSGSGAPLTEATLREQGQEPALAGPSSVGVAS